MVSKDGFRRRWGIPLTIGVLVGFCANVAPVKAHVGDTIAHLWAHLRPKMDQRFYTKAQANARFLPGRALAAGSTLRGTFWMGGSAAAGFDIVTSEISFGHTFAAAPTAHFIQQGGTPPAECPGTHDNPQAAAGHLCVYERSVINGGVRDVNGPVGDGTTYSFGARLFLRSAAAGDYWSMGTWAATAPAATAGAAVDEAAVPGTEAGL